MEINGRTALVTGANRGLGRHLAEQLRDRGAHVYAAVRNPDTVDLDGVTPIRLDLNDEASIAEAVAVTSDVSILINNAGTCSETSLLTGSMVDIRAEFDTNFYGPLLVDPRLCSSASRSRPQCRAHHPLGPVVVQPPDDRPLLRI